MNKEKQIEIERLRLLLVGCGDISKDLRKEATKAIDRGYRKAAEVAEEIFAEIDKLLAVDRNGEANLDVRDLAELKKKYIGEDTNVLTNTEDGE